MLCIESHIFSDYTCKSNYDCYHRGYCHVGVCKCLPEYGYKVDCSSYGCKCPPQNTHKTQKKCQLRWSTFALADFPHLLVNVV